MKKKRPPWLLPILLILIAHLFASACVATTLIQKNTTDYPPEDIVYVTEIGGFKEIIIIPKGSLNPEHQGKTWQTKNQWEAEWKQALEWRDEILKEQEENQQ